MSTLQYRGRSPDSDFHVIHKKYVDDRYATIKVDTAYIQSQVVAEVANRGLVDSAYVDSQDSLLAHRAAVDSADSNYIPATQLGVPGGVASLDAGVYVPASQLPPLETERKVFVKNADVVYLSSGTHDVTQPNAREYKAAELNVPDLGYPYIPLLFAVLQGGAISAPTNYSRALGTGNYAQISILHTDNTRRGYTITTGQRGYDFFTCLPSPDANTLLSGAHTFNLWLGLHTGTTFTFKAEGLRFFAMCFPGL